MKFAQVRFSREVANPRSWKEGDSNNFFRADDGYEITKEGDLLFLKSLYSGRIAVVSWNHVIGAEPIEEPVLTIDAATTAKRSKVAK